MPSEGDLTLLTKEAEKDGGERDRKGDKRDDATTNGPRPLQDEAEHEVRGRVKLPKYHDCYDAIRRNVSRLHPTPHKCEVERVPRINSFRPSISKLHTPRCNVSHVKR